MFNDGMREKLQLVADELGVEVEALMAVVQVECGGKYFANVNGREEPIIRFEGHYFYKLLSKSKRNKAVVKGLANRRAGRVRNPFSQRRRWAMLDKACEIDRSAALSSISWGVGQVMGIHWRWLGYGSIDALVLEARNGLLGQVRLMARFIQKAGLVEKLVARDWAGFARAYNGPGYRRNRYDTKMATAYQKFLSQDMSNEKRIKPTHSRHGMVHLKLGSLGPDVLALQNQLGSLGYHLARDGDFGPATERMVKRFQRARRLKPDGIVGPKTFEMLMRNLPAHLL